MAEDFLNHLFIDLKQKEINIPGHWDVDHLCYRTEFFSRYQELKDHFSEFANLLIESDVNGRPIATYQLHRPVRFREWLIDVVELPAPKASKTTKEGFEHIEIVCDVPFSELENKYRHLPLKLDGLKKDFNQEFEIHLGTRNLKFHHLSLKSVINLEKNVAVYAALNSSGILKDFKKYRPLVAGTFPLAIQVKTSDLDILMVSDDLKKVQEELTAAYEQKEHFKAMRLLVDNLETLLVTFTFENVHFEIFVQNYESVRQTAYLHFLCEERLLKLKGESFRKEILALRQRGLKTEPAFAAALNKNVDPFELILNLQKRSHKEIESL